MNEECHDGFPRVGPELREKDLCLSGDHKRRQRQQQGFEKQELLIQV